ncbi:MAG: hypothetical protein NBKEAIPA_00436 [Nitrospirae bacterium]|nr:hypothetical protein [Nitrospirota bacterium]
MTAQGAAACPLRSNPSNDLTKHEGRRPFEGASASLCNRVMRTQAAYFFPRIASLAILATRNFTTRFAGILIGSPV